MKLQIDTSEKTIKVEEQVNFGELVKILNKLLPKGEWKTYKLETNTVINWNQYPVWTYPRGIYPPYPTEEPYYIECGTTSGYATIGCLITTDGVGDTTTNANVPFTLTEAATGTYNIEAN